MNAIIETYETALADLTFVNRSKAAFDAANNAAMGEVMRKHHILFPVHFTAEMAAEAVALRKAAIGF